MPFGLVDLERCNDSGGSCAAKVLRMVGATAVVCLHSWKLRNFDVSQLSGRIRL